MPGWLWGFLSIPIGTAILMAILGAFGLLDKKYGIHNVLGLATILGVLVIVIAVIARVVSP